MPKLRNIIYLFVFIAISQVLIVGVMHVFALSYHQAGNWVFGISIALIAISAIHLYIQSKKIQRNFVDMHKKVDFSKDTEEMLVQYRTLIERLDDPDEKTRLLKELDLIEVINKSGNELHAAPSADSNIIKDIEHNLQRLKDVRKRHKK